MLFLDELPEFNRRVLELLRQPLEDEYITISRNRGCVKFPAKILLVASMNLCPCGHLGDPRHECTCTQWQIQRYLSKLSAPLMDRIDITLNVLPVEYNKMKSKRNISTEEMRISVIKARNAQLERYDNDKISYNSQLTPGLIEKYCKLDYKSAQLMESAYKSLGMSVRSYHKTITLARTIADMEESREIEFNHIAEALQFKNGFEGLKNGVF